MCSGHPLDWACDECFARYQQHKHKQGEFKFCAECKETERYMCFCCMFQSDKPLEGNICKSCEEDFDTKGGN